MNSRQIELVEQSFSKVQPIAAQTARLFYQRLFELDPSLRPMFHGDIEEQGRKLMEIIGLAVISLRQWDKVVPAIEDMGRRHAGYGVREDHYGTVAFALLWTLEQRLGREQFTDEVSRAWVAMFWLFTDAMLRGAAFTAGL